MNIYFACSITGGREFEAVYQVMVHALVKAGHEVPTAHLVEADVGMREAALSPQEVYARDTAWIRACDALIAEVSVPSHGVGYEIGFALGMGKPVLAVYQEGRRLSKMISGNPASSLTVKTYHTPEEAIQVIERFLSSL
ncbi:MAG: nucleoside 2-deoxyribosyltransferase [Chloroflexota bacterium]|nr:nucleoside 2-deoxyribosyltransferase [Chloroflexota bacterium]MBI5704903.1 nucleoside 2-deoxyribosyltransferase [Chloroflexota bacterium]